MQANAIKNATQAQIDALERQRDFVFSQLDPSRVGREVLGADISRIQQQLALQGITDPAALQTRYEAENQILRRVMGLEGGPAEQVAQVAAEEAIAGTPGLQEGKNALVDAALQELRLGATLPPDVQAELVQAGLERSGEVVGGPTGGRGTSGQILRQVLGSAGVQLQAERQQRAAGLLQSASDLEARRQSILGTLFPNLSTVQLNTLQGAQSALKTSSSLVPEAGLSGQDVANLWLARVGSTNQLAQQAANIGAAGGMGAAQAWQPAFGAAIPAVGGLLPSTRQVWGQLTAPSSPAYGSTYAGAGGTYMSVPTAGGGGASMLIP
jgi:hypothetical protein